jgi:hypothetical protein
MAEYNAKSDKTQHFSLTKGASTLGELTYKDWFSFESTIVLANKELFHIKPKGLWGTTIELKQAAVTLLHFTMDWKGNIIISTIFQNQPRDFVFKQKGILRNEYVLTDSEHQELLVLQPDFKWKEFDYDYTIQTTDAFEDLPSKELLLLVIVHCTNYYIAMMMGVIALI